MAIAIDAIDYVERLMSIQTMLKAWKTQNENLNLKPWCFNLDIYQRENIFSALRKYISVEKRLSITEMMLGCRLEMSEDVLDTMS